jgi:hypothetical protein
MMNEAAECANLLPIFMSWYCTNHTAIFSSTDLYLHLAGWTSTQENFHQHHVAFNCSQFLCALLEQVCCCSFSISQCLSLSHSKRSRTFIYIIYLYQRSVEVPMYIVNNYRMHADECMYRGLRSGALAEWAPRNRKCMQSSKEDISHMQVEWAPWKLYLSL